MAANAARYMGLVDLMKQSDPKIEAKLWQGYLCENDIMGLSGFNFDPYFKGKLHEIVPSKFTRAASTGTAQRHRYNCYASYSAGMLRYGTFAQLIGWLETTNRHAGFSQIHGMCVMGMCEEILPDTIAAFVRLPSIAPKLGQLIVSALDILGKLKATYQSPTDPSSTAADAQLEPDDMSKELRTWLDWRQPYAIQMSTATSQKMVTELEYICEALKFRVMCIMRETQCHFPDSTKSSLLRIGALITLEGRPELNAAFTRDLDDPISASSDPEFDKFEILGAEYVASGLLDGIIEDVDETKGYDWKTQLAKVHCRLDDLDGRLFSGHTSQTVREFTKALRQLIDTKKTFGTQVGRLEECRVVAKRFALIRLFCDYQSGSEELVVGSNQGNTGSQEDGDGPDSPPRTYCMQLYKAKLQALEEASYFPESFGN